MGHNSRRAKPSLNKIYPYEGWVEHDPEAIWQTTLDVSRQVVAECQQRGIQLVCVGIANQRETTVVWNRDTGQPIFNAIVWQDRRTAADCRDLVKAGQEHEVQSRNGIIVGPLLFGH